MDNVYDEFYQKSHYNIIRVLLSINGLWPFHTFKRRCTIYLAFLLVLGSGLTFEVLGIIEVWHNSFEVVDCLPFLVLAVVSLIKLIYAIYTLPEIKILLLKIREYYLSPKSNEETNILHSYARYGKIMGYIYTALVFGHFFIYVCLTLLKKLLNDRSSMNNDTLNGDQVGLLFRVNYMVDLDTYYIPIFIHTTTCDTFFSILIITFDIFYLTLVQHCCGQFAAIRYRLEYADEVKNDDSQRIHTKDKIYSNIIYSLRRHAEVIQFTTVMESVHRLPLFVHVGANVSTLSVLGFQVITNKEDIAVMLRHALFFSALLINTFFENWQGQKIIDSSEKVFDSVYNAKWYNMSNKHRKLLMIAMILSSKSLKLTAGNIFVLSYINFNAVVRTSSSYFMLLRSMQ